MLVYPTAIGSEPDHPDFDTEPLWERVIIGNAIANGVFMVAVNRFGEEAPLRFYGSSFICDPYGRKLVQAPRDEPAVLVADLDLDQRHDWLELFPFLRGRRPDVYAGVLDRSPPAVAARRALGSTGHAGDLRRPGKLSGVDARQQEAPYLDALLEYAQRNPARLHVPGHKGGQGADEGLLHAIGERALSLDIPALTHGIDVGPDPTPFEHAQRLAAEAWGAKRAWFLINGASQGNLAVGLALAQRGSEVVVQRNAHSSTIDALVLSGLRPTFAAPELDAELGIGHCLTPETLAAALAATPSAVGAWVASPTYFGAVADVRALAGVAHRARRAPDRGRGMGRPSRLPREAARACPGERAPTW